MTTSHFRLGSNSLSSDDWFVFKISGGHFNYNLDLMLGIFILVEIGYDYSYFGLGID